MSTNTQGIGLINGLINTDAATYATYSTLPLNSDAMTYNNAGIQIRRAVTAQLGIGTLSEIASLACIDNKRDIWNSGVLTEWDKTTISNIAVNTLALHLYPTDTKVSQGYSYEVGKVSDLVDKGIGGKIKNMAVQITQLNSSISSVLAAGAGENDANIKEMAAGIPEFMSRFSEVPYFKGVSSTGLSSITFEFNFGQDYLFSAEHEVVRPIYRLADIFAPTATGTPASIQKIDAPVPGATQVLTSYYKHLFFGSGTTATTTAQALAPINSSEGAESLRGSAVNFLGGIAEAISKAGAAQEVRVFMLRLGDFYLGPYFPKDVSWEFDSTNTDENGLPCKGRITYGGLINIITDTNKSFNSSIGLV